MADQEAPNNGVQADNRSVPALASAGLHRAGGRGKIGAKVVDASKRRSGPSLRSGPRFAADADGRSADMSYNLKTVSNRYSALEPVSTKCILSAGEDQMGVHWKFGDGFAIRYGGNSDIQWFQGEDVERAAHLVSGAAGGGWVGAVVEGLKAVALFLQWWEMRKQTALQTAAFEERRVQWLVEILGQLAFEWKEGTLRVDTIHYLDREVSRLLEKLASTDKMDVPSIVLLHAERLTNALVAMNGYIDQQISDQAPNFVLPAHPDKCRFRYRPYFAVGKEENNPDIDDYLRSAASEVVAIAAGYAATNLGPMIAFNTLSPLLFPILGTTLLASSLLEKLGRDSTKAERLAEFKVLLNLQLELRSSNTLLRELRMLPTGLQAFSLRPSVKNPRLFELIDAGENESADDVHKRRRTSRLTSRKRA